jgi:hypothetical protein
VNRPISVRTARAWRVPSPPFARVFSNPRSRPQLLDGCRSWRLRFEPLAQCALRPPRFQPHDQHVKNCQKHGGERQPCASEPKQNKPERMLARIERRLQERRSGKQKHQRDNEQNEHGFTARVVVTDDPARRVNYERDRPQRFFVRGIVCHPICQRIRARYLSILRSVNSKATRR